MTINDRLDEELVLARTQKLKTLQDDAEKFAHCMQPQRTVYDPYCKTTYPLQEWLNGSWLHWRLPQSALSPHVNELHYCLSNSAIEYILSVSINPYEFWSFVAKVLKDYERDIYRVQSDRKSYTLWQQTNPDGIIPDFITEKLHPLPELPMPANIAQECLEKWSTFGDDYFQVFNDLFPDAIRHTLLSADLEKDLSHNQLMFLATNQLLVHQVLEPPKQNYDYATHLHPLAKAILTKEANTRQE